MRGYNGSEWDSDGSRDTGPAGQWEKIGFTLFASDRVTKGLRSHIQEVTGHEG